MTTDVVAVSPETPLKEVAQLLIEHGISGMPVVDPERRVLGVVSETDIIHKERDAGFDDETGFLRRLTHRRDRDLESKHEARTAGEAMTEPAVTARESDSIALAATLMIDHGVTRLPVVDREGRLLGLVARADFVRAFARSDDEITAEIDSLLTDEYMVIREASRSPSRRARSRSRGRRM